MKSDEVMSNWDKPAAHLASDVLGDVTWPPQPNLFLSQKTSKTTKLVARKSNFPPSS